MPVTTRFHLSGSRYRRVDEAPHRRLRGNVTSFQGSGSSPTGQSISIGPPLAMPRATAAPSSSGEDTRTASRPKLSPSFTKSGLRKSDAMVRFLNDCYWMRRTLP